MIGAINANLVKELREAARVGDMLGQNNYRLAANEIMRLRSDLETARKALESVKHWAGSQCPCENDLPDPCPLCGARVSKDKCMAIEGALPPVILEKIDAALLAHLGT